MKPYVCPRCFKPAPDTDARGACPACGYTSDGASVLLGCSLALLLLVLTLSLLLVLFIRSRMP
jgi:hypothetical protein